MGFMVFTNAALPSKAMQVVGPVPPAMDLVTTTNVIPDAATLPDHFFTSIVPPEGESPLNPGLPAPLQTINDLWDFPPVVVTDPGRVWWFDPEVAIG